MFHNLPLFQTSRRLVGMLTALFIVLTGCVSTQQYEALQSQLDEAEEENAALRLSRQDAEISSRELEGELAKLTGQHASLSEDVERIGAQAKLLREEVARLTELNEALTDQSSGRLSNIAEENRQLLEDVMRIREELQEREDRLNRLERDLNEKSALLEARSQRVQELESQVANRDVRVLFAYLFSLETIHSPFSRHLLTPYSIYGRHKLQRQRKKQCSNEMHSRRSSADTPLPTLSSDSHKRFIVALTISGRLLLLQSANDLRRNFELAKAEHAKVRIRNL